MNATTRGRLRAFQHDNVLRWRVESLSRPELVHVVDLAAYTGNGACSCEHFQFRLEPALREGLVKRGQATRCGHILVAREAFTNHMLQLLTARAREIEAAEAHTRPCPRCCGELEEADGTPCEACEGRGIIPE